MYDERKKKIISRMKENDIEVSIITSMLNIYYLTGYYSNPRERFTSLIINASGDNILIVPSLNRQGAEIANVTKLVDYQDHENPYLLIETFIQNGKVALEENHWTIERFKKLTQIIPDITVFDIGPWIDHIRKIKSSDEIIKIKRAISITEEALEYGISILNSNITERELALEIEYKMKKLGADKLSFDVKVISGERSSLPHGKSSTQTIKENSFVLFDMGVSIEGYLADISRTVVLGAPTEKMIHIYETVRQASERSIANIKPGVKISELDKIARDYIHTQGYGPYFIHRLGHGLGLDLHEYPSIHEGNSDTLEKGMVFTIEPGIYIPEIGGVRIEDDVLVTENGVEVLTKADKQLRIKV